jgi:hypothetical protein
MPAKVGENMDDLLSWLFNTNTPGTGGDWGFGIQQGQTQQDMLPTFTTEPLGVGPRDEAYPSYYPADTNAGSGSLNYGSSDNYHVQSNSNPHTQYPSTALHGGDTGMAHISNTAPGPSQSQPTTNKRYPQPYHPLYVPNIPVKTNIPTFNGSGNERASIQGRERYKEVIDEEVKDTMLDLFEVGYRSQVVMTADETS